MEDKESEVIRRVNQKEKKRTGKCQKRSDN